MNRKKNCRKPASVTVACSGKCENTCFYYAPNYSQRLFDTGATRDTDIDKLDFRGFFSPIVLQRFAQYMHEHRLQSDGTMRASDNWKKTYGKTHYDVCLSSLLRHVIDLWLIHEGFSRRAKETLEDALCAILFNTMAYLFKVLTDQYDIKKEDLPGKDIIL